MGRKGKKRLSVDLPEGVHRMLKSISKKKKCTITKIILRAIVEYVVKYSR